MTNEKPEITITIRQPCESCNRISFAEFPGKEIKQTIVGKCPLCASTMRFEYECRADGRTLTSWANTIEQERQRLNRKLAEMIKHAEKYLTTDKQLAEFRELIASDYLDNIQK
jgi:hypothetical protein